MATLGFIEADWSIDAAGNVRYIGDDHNGADPSYCTVIQLHRALQDFADNATASGDDLMDISIETPSDRSTDNIITLVDHSSSSGPTFNINDLTAEHLYDGSIIQGTSGAVTTYDGIVNFGNAEVEIGIIQNGDVLTDDYWNRGSGGNNATGGEGVATAGSTGDVLTVSGKTWTVNQWTGYMIYNVTKGAMGLIESNTSTTITAQMYGVASAGWATSDVFYIAKGLNSDATNGISHRFLLKTQNAGTPVDNKKVIGFSRTYGKTFSEFTINATASGNNVLALSNAGDLNNTTVGDEVHNGTAFVAPFNTISNTEGYQGIDINGDSVNEFYYTQFDRNQATTSINQLYEWSKFVTRYKSTEYDLFGFGAAGSDGFRGITHDLTVSGGGGAEVFVQNEIVSWGTGTGQLLAADNLADVSTTKMWIQLLTGVAPVATDTLTGAAGSVTVDAVSSRTLNPTFLGQSTGSALIAGYGIGLAAPSDVTQNDTFFDLTNTQRTPPNNVTFTVGGLSTTTGEDYVFVAPRTGSGATATINETQMTVASASLTGAAVGSVTVNAIPSSGVPSTGTIRIVNDDSYHVRIPYNDITGSVITFTAPVAFNGTQETANATIGAGVYFSYIDEATPDTSGSLSYTAVHTSGSQPLLVRVRDGAAGSPIKPIQAEGTFTSTSATVNVSRQPDQ